MKNFRILTALCILTVIGTFLGTSAFALNVPRSENANTPSQASDGLSTAATSSATADDHVPA